MMQQETNQQRIQNMYQMLLEMGGGNFTKRIQRSGQDDELEALVVLVNMVAEEMKGSVFHTGFVNPRCTYKNLVQTTFILDSDCIIKSYNSAVPILLGFSDEMLLNKPFSTILSEESLPTWNCAKEEILQDQSYNSSLLLTYTTQDRLLVPCICTISRLLHSTSILISSVTTVVDETIVSKALVSPDDIPLLRGFSNYADVQLIQHVYDYILDHLDSPLPSLKELSQFFGTNDNKLKYGFKLLFKTSVYQFYTTERLKRSHLIIQQTTIPLKVIASTMGFNTYSNFSRAFKKQFNYAPNEVIRR
jgi:AraC-like DNA-binding protein